MTFQSPINSLWTIAMSNTGFQLATGGDSPEGFIGDAKDLSLPTTMMKSHQPNISNIVWSADDRLIATGSRDGSVCLWDSLSGPVLVCLSILNVYPGAVQDVMFSPNSARIVTTYATLGNNPAAVAALWDTASGQLITMLSGHEQRILSLAVAPDGRIATGSMDGTCKIWSVRGRERFTYNQWERMEEGTRAVGSVAFSPDSKYIAIGWDNGQLDIRESHSEKLCRSFKYRSFAINSVAYSHTGRLVAIGCGLGNIAVWDMVSKKMLVETVSEKRGAVKKVVFSQDDQHLITQSDLGVVHVWSLQGVLGGR